MKWGRVYVIVNPSFASKATIIVTVEAQTADEALQKFEGLKDRPTPYKGYYVDQPFQLNLDDL